MPDKGDDPRATAERLVAEHDEVWLATFLDELYHRRLGRQLRHVMQSWSLSVADLAQLFATSESAAAKWAEDGVPTECEAQAADMAAMSELMDLHLKPERIAAVVRQSAPALGNETLLTLIADRQSAEALRLTRQMFAFADAES